MELPNEVHERIVAISKQGDDLAARQHWDDAIAAYRGAWDLLPDPKEDWDAATWLLAAIGDAQFLKKDYDASFLTFVHAMRCPGALGNPFIHLRLGELHFEAGTKNKALDELTRAYMGAGDRIFSREDPKYFAFLKANILPPA
jgi:tetratricopeptide (TPR) repeat protein